MDVDKAKSEVYSIWMYKVEFENKIAIAEANLGTALEERAKVQKVHDTLVAAKNEVKMAIDGGGSAVQDLVDKTKRTEGMAADIEKQVSSVEKRVDVEIQQKQQLEQQMNKVTSQVSQIEGEVRSLESALTASEEERALKDEQINNQRRNCSSSRYGGQIDKGKKRFWR